MYLLSNLPYKCPQQVFLDSTSNDHGIAFVYLAWSCDVYLQDAPGEFASPKWPGSYPSDRRCSWRITAPEGNRIRIQFTSFALEQHALGHCNDKFDHVRLLDGGTVGSPLIGLYCGNQAPFSISSTGRDMFVQFTSDHDPHSSRQGFHATFEFEPLNGSHVDPDGLIDSRYIDLGKVKDWEGTDQEDTRVIGGKWLEAIIQAWHTGWLSADNVIIILLQVISSSHGGSKTELLDIRFNFSGC